MSWMRRPWARSAATPPGRCTTWHTGWPTTAGGTTRWPRPKNPPASAAGWPRVALARLLQRIVRPGDTEFDSYLEQTGAVEVPDEGPE
jgi:hypothetical protein